MSENTGSTGGRSVSSSSDERVAGSASSRKFSRKHRITQVDLKKYEFSPPGPMGWTAKEYEKMIDNLRHRKGE